MPTEHKGKGKQIHDESLAKTWNSGVGEMYTFLLMSVSRITGILANELRVKRDTLRLKLVSDISSVPYLPDIKQQSFVDLHKRGLDAYNPVDSV